MHTLTTRLSRHLATGLGRCTRCMRLALAAALGAALVLALARSVAPGSLAAGIAALATAALFAVWLAHLTAYALRSERGARPASAGRRQALAVVLRAAAIGALASIPLSLLSDKALAFCGQCAKDEDCGTWKCKDTAPVGSGTTCWECVNE